MESLPRGVGAEESTLDGGQHLPGRLYQLRGGVWCECESLDDVKPARPWWNTLAELSRGGSLDPQGDQPRATVEGNVEKVVGVHLTDGDVVDDFRLLWGPDHYIPLSISVGC
jgi:hypothetical protein